MEIRRDTQLDKLLLDDEVSGEAESGNHDQDEQDNRGTQDTNVTARAEPKVSEDISAEPDLNKQGKYHLKIKCSH